MLKLFDIGFELLNSVLIANSRISVNWFLADRTNGRAIVTLFRLSVVCRL